MRECPPAADQCRAADVRCRVGVHLPAADPCRTADVYPCGVQRPPAAAPGRAGDVRRWVKDGRPTADPCRLGVCVSCGVVALAGGRLLPSCRRPSMKGDGLAGGQTKTTRDCRRLVGRSPPAATDAGREAFVAAAWWGSDRGGKGASVSSRRRLGPLPQEELTSAATRPREQATSIRPGGA